MLSVDVRGSLCSRLSEKALLAFEGHDEAASAGCILSIFRKRRDMLRLDLSKSWMPVVKVLVDSSAWSTEVLPVPFNDSRPLVAMTRENCLPGKDRQY